MLLWKQHFIQNNQLLLLAAVAYVGVIFFVLSIAHLGNRLRPHNLEIFGGFMLGFVGIAGILYVGHSFPALRSKERTINYLMVPASLPEKFLFEFISRVGIVFVVLPFLFWITFHLQGYFVALFSEHAFQPIGFNALSEIDLQAVDKIGWISTMIISGIMLGFTLAFTGSAMFTKQPLVKTLFSLAIIMMFYSGFAYIAVEQFGVGKYNPTDSMWLIPTNEVSAFSFFSVALILANVAMLFVGYRKLKEREV